MKKWLFISLEIIIILLTCSCQQKDSLVAEYDLEYVIDKIEYKSDIPLHELVNNEDSYEELITESIDIHETIDTLESYRGLDIGEMYEKIGIECLRHTDEGALYSVHKVKQGGLLYVFYHFRPGDDDKELLDAYTTTYIYVREELNYSDFDTIIYGESTINDVIKIDESTQIAKNIVNSINNEGLVAGGYGSFHYLKDGILIIYYDCSGEEIIVNGMKLLDNYLLHDFVSANVNYCNAHVLEMDRIKRR